MKKIKHIASENTVSCAEDRERVIKGNGISFVPFDYQQFCREVLQGSKRKADACFLVPLKAYHDREELHNEKMFDWLEIWLDTFIKKGNDCIYFWSYLVYVDRYCGITDSNVSKRAEDHIGPNAEKSAKGCMNDVSKLDRNKYIKDLCEDRECIEAWILKAYEMILKRMYPGGELALFVKTMIEYLRSCGLKISMPATRWAQEGEIHIAQSASQLMLLVIRLRAGIPREKAMEWYRQENVAYSYCYDRKLDEYMQLVENYTYHSYERFVMMGMLAKEGQNKYAAKEVGDVYRVGAVLQDSCGTEIAVLADQNMAVEYYRVCGQENYIPSYSAAVRTNMLIDDQQSGALLEEARQERNPDALAFYAEQCLAETEKYIMQDAERGLAAFSDLVDAVLTLEHSYWQKHVLKNRILMSATYSFCKENMNIVSEELRELLCNLYEIDPFGLEQEALVEELIQSYQTAGSFGYFEMEYRLGKLFQNIDPVESREHYRQGNQKGCNWCMLEYAKLKKADDSEKWLRSLMDIGKKQITEDLRLQLAEELSQCDCVLGDMETGKIRWQKEELMDLYSQIARIEKWMDGYTAAEEPQEKTKRIDVQRELLKRQMQVEKLIEEHEIRA